MLELANCRKCAVLLVICKVLAIEVLETVKVAGASEFLEMGNFADKLQGFSGQEGKTSQKSFVTQTTRGTIETLEQIYIY